MPNVGVVALELCEEFVGIRESAIWFAEARDSVDDELAETVITNEVKQAARELAE